MKRLSIFPLMLLALGLCGCGSNEPEPVQGDSPAAASGREVTPDMQRSGGPPRNTLPAGQGRGGGPTNGAGGDSATTR